MSNATTEKRAGWFTGLIDGAARAFAFGANSGTEGSRSEKAERKSEKSGRKIEMKGLTLQVQRLVADGHTAAEIARRTAMSQDTIALLLHLRPSGSDETAAHGTIFRATQIGSGARQ